MEPIENNYRKRFKDQELPADDGFNSQGLWDAVSTELDASVATRPLWGIRWFYVAILGMLLVGFGLFFWSTNVNESATGLASQTSTVEQVENIENNQNSADVARNEPATQTLKNTTIAQETNNQSTVDEATSQLATAQAITTTNEQEIKNEDSAPTAITANTTSTTTTGAPFSETKETEDPTTNDSTIVQTSVAKAPLILEKNTAEAIETNSTATTITNKPTAGNLNTNTAFAETGSAVEVSPSSKLEPNANLPSTITTAKQSLSVARLASLPTKYLPTDVSFNAKPTLAEKRVEPLKTTQWLLGVSGGLTYLRPNFTATSDSEFSTVKNQTETADWGYNLSLNTTMVWRKHTLLQAGIEYEQIRTTFAYEYSYDTTVILNNVLLEVLIDSTTGIVIEEIYGDTVVAGTVSRELMKNNQYNSLNLPISLGRQWTRGKWNYGISAGAVLRFQREQRGQTWSPEEEVVSFTDKEQEVLFAKVGLGVRLSPFVGCRLGRGLLLTLSPRWTWQQNSIFEQPGLRAKTQNFGLQLGVKMAIGKR